MTEAARIIKQRLMADPPDAAIILGSSLDDVSAIVEQPAMLPYAELPGFPVPKISGHAGKLAAGKVGDARVLILRGRAHPYESGNAAVMRPVIETLAQLGTRALIVTNAAGSLDYGVGPGRIVLITDHINFSGMNPLIGESGDAGFVPMTDAYDPALAERLRRAAQREKITLAEGTYIWFSGPSFETPAEIWLAQRMGANVVGMSTVPEVILARRFGLTVAALSVVTNLGAGMAGASPSHGETKTEGRKAAGDMIRLLTSFFTGRRTPNLGEEAVRAIGLLDLTNLNDTCSAADIRDLCARARTPRGNVAAVCIWPEWIELAAEELTGSGVRIATVVNFPAGGTDTAKVSDEVKSALAKGADEIDVVIPYRSILLGRPQEAAKVIAAARAATPERKVLKVILETGELRSRGMILLAADIALAEGADFLKTSTGKVAVNATPEAAETLLYRIRRYGGRVGFKGAGGIKTAKDAAHYLGIADRIMGEGWVSPETFRFGASGVLSDLIAAAEGKAAAASTGY